MINKVPFNLNKLEDKFKFNKNLIQKKKTYKINKKMIYFQLNMDRKHIYTTN